MFESCLRNHDLVSTRGELFWTEIPFQTEMWTNGRRGKRSCRFGGFGGSNPPSPTIKNKDYCLLCGDSPYFLPIEAISLASDGFSCGGWITYPHLILGALKRKKSILLLYGGGWINRAIFHIAYSWPKLSHSWIIFFSLLFVHPYNV